MSSTATEVLIAVIGVIVSVVASIYSAGRRSGLNEGNMNARFAKVEDRMETMGKDLSEIKGMFVLRLRDDSGPPK